MSQIDSAETLHRELVQLIAQRAYERRRPGVSSGDSDFYIDTKFVSLHPRGAYCIGQLILKRLKALDCHTVARMSIGAIHIDSAIAALSAEAGLKAQRETEARDAAAITAGRNFLASEAMQCTECHQFRKPDEDASAPDLTGYGSREWLMGIMGHPKHDRFYGKRNDRMPSFGETSRLTARELELLIRWLRGD